MIIDPQDTRKISGNWREYLHEMKESVAIIRWIYREFITADSRRWTRPLAPVRLDPVHPPATCE